MSNNIESFGMVLVGFWSLEFLDGWFGLLVKAITCIFLTFSTIHIIRGWKQKNKHNERLLDEIEKLNKKIENLKNKEKKD